VFSLSGELALPLRCLVNSYALEQFDLLFETYALAAMRVDELLSKQSPEQDLV
jgi:hypothetical protein